MNAGVLDDGDVMDVTVLDAGAPDVKVGGLAHEHVAEG